MTTRRHCPLAVTICATGIDIVAFHPAILIGGAMIALLTNTWSVVAIRFMREGEKRWFVIVFMNHGWNLAVLFIAAASLFIMFAYLVVENLIYVACG